MDHEQVLIITGQAAKSAASTRIDNLPEDGSMEVVIRRHMKKRSKPQNALMWAGRIKDISEQAWVDGRQYGTDIWHEYLKARFLPEGNEPEFEKLVLKDYRKWADMPDGSRKCIGSTTKLTTLGMVWYSTNLEAYCAQELGVRFTDLRQE